MSDYTELKKAALSCLELAETSFKVPAELQFERLATPQTLLIMIGEIKQLKAELECARGDLKTAGQIIERYENDAACFNYLAACKEWPDAISDLIDSGSTVAIRAAILKQIEKEFN